MIEAYVLLGTLGVHSIEDLREKKITVTVTLFSGILGVLLHLLFRRQSIYEMLAGMLSGTIILAVSRFTGGKIGMGDGIVFMLTGLYLGVLKNFTLMFLSFSLAGIWGVYLMAARGHKKNEKIPLIPFLFLGYCIMMIV